MMEYEYKGRVSEEMLQASRDARMLNEYGDMDNPDAGWVRDRLKDFDATIAYLAGQGDEVGASILRDERARYG